MKNTPENREMIAKKVLESFTFEEMMAALTYELTERYEREPEEFESIVGEFEELGDFDELEE